MLTRDRKTSELDHETALFVAELAADAADVPSTAALLTIEHLRRLEDTARSAGTSRQALQKIMSARRVLGDMDDFGRFRGSYLSD